MLFNSFEFFTFLAIIFGLSLTLSRRAANRMLLVASYAFYAAWDWRFCSLLALSTLVDFAVGRHLAATADPRRRLWLVRASLATNLSILGFFKYAGFFAESLQDLFGLVGGEIPAFALEVVLPVGISFYTFQTLSYTLDIYRRRMEPTSDLLDFALFVALFPQLVAGPIERARNLLPQIAQRPRVRWEQVGSGAWLVLWGIFKKVVIADRLAGLVDIVYAPGASPTGPEVLLAAYAFAFQIYCDFSGYTDIARGTARMLGFHLMQNFRHPYAATSPADYWRRWHISLSTWLRDYLYFSLGGNRGARSRVTTRILATMLLAGLWHGAAWTFVVWGGIHGGLLVLHRLFLPWLERIRPQAQSARAAWRGLRVFVTFHLIAGSLIVFRSENLSQAASLLGRFLAEPTVGLAASWVAPLALLVAPLVLMEVAQSRARDPEVLLRWPLAVRASVYGMIMALIVVYGEDGGQPFVYFQF